MLIADGKLKSSEDHLLITERKLKSFIWVS